MGHGADARAVAGARRDPEALRGVAETLHALATPSRLAILLRLRDGDCTVGELAGEVAAVREQFPRLLVHTVSETGDPATVLTRLGRGALEIVVGATARHGLERLLLGSVAHDTLRGASRPVIVVPDPAVAS